MPKLRGLRRARELAALTQAELGERANVAQHSISQLETGERIARPATVRKLADALGVEPRELIDPGKPA